VQQIKHKFKIQKVDKMDIQPCYHFIYIFKFQNSYINFATSSHPPTGYLDNRYMLSGTQIMSTSHGMERLEQYFEVNEISNEKRVPALLGLIGGKTYTLLRNLTTLEKQKDKS
jgi:hypothetical protein